MDSKLGDIHMANYSNAALGLLTGAGTGATIGSAFGPIGTGVGAGLGGLIGGGAGLFGAGAGTESRTQQFQKYTPAQQNILNQLLSRGFSGLNNPTEGFDPIENRARTQFQTQTIPSLAERFTALGGNERGSSAFQGALGSAASGLEEALAALRAQYGMQNRQLALSELGLGLTPQFENAYFRQQPGGFESFLTAAAPGFSKYATERLLGGTGQQQNQIGGQGGLGETGQNNIGELMKLFNLIRGVK